VLAMSVSSRIRIYFLATLVVEGIIFITAYLIPAAIILATNFGYLYVLYINSIPNAFYGHGSGALGAGFLALGIGVLCLFFEIALIGEVLNWHSNRHKKRSQTKQAF
jgi:hypothetical protein